MAQTRGTAWARSRRSEPVPRRTMRRLATGTLLTSLAATSGLAYGSAAAAADTGFPADRPQVVGHRGGLDSPGTENSLQALRTALASGADAVEFDVQWTRDAGAVLMHDATMNRTTNCSGTVSRMTYASFRTCELDDGSRAPNLYEALMVVRAYPNAHAYVHVRGLHNRAEGRRLTHALNKYGLNNAARTTVVTTSRPQLWTAKKHGFQGRRGLLFGDASGWSAGYNTLLPYNTSVTPELVRTAQARGKEVVLTEGHPIELGQVAALNVDGYMANGLQAALAALSRAVAEVNGRIDSLDR
ncbi:MAG: glycerophosphodiester phosphodiesterase [Sporichthyaceae bacterium]